MGKLYQPTTVEIAGLWAQKTPTSAGYQMFVAAEQLLANIDAAFTLRKGNILVYDAHAKRAALLTNNATTCTCAEFNQAPFVPPQRIVRHCRHTLAWQGYARILRRHYQVLRGHTPGNLITTDRWKLGEHHPADVLAYLLFAEWLVGTPLLSRSRAKLAQEQALNQHPHAHAARRAAAQGTVQETPCKQPHA
jgi:hypothetical protein